MLSENYYNLANNLSSACRVFAIAVLGVLLVEPYGIKCSNWLYYLVITFFVIDIFHYFIALLFIQKWDKGLYKQKIENDEVSNKLHNLRTFTIHIIYAKMLIVMTILICLFTIV